MSEYGVTQDVNKILNMSGTVEDKQVMLRALRGYAENLFKEAEKKIFEDYRFCGTCMKWYRKNSYEGNICPLGHFVNE